jgi:hypothetical protein
LSLASHLDCRAARDNAGTNISQGASISVCTPSTKPNHPTSHMLHHISGIRPLGQAASTVTSLLQTAW